MVDDSIAAQEWRKSATEEHYYRLVTGPLETLDLRKDSPEAKELCTKSSKENPWRVMHGFVVIECRDAERTSFILRGYDLDWKAVVKVQVPNPDPEGFEGSIPEPITDPFNSHHAKWTVLGPLLSEP
jgi:hypothetical protein